MTNYYDKYLFYKKKYLELKNIQSGGLGDIITIPVGINFEGGKIIRYIKNSPKCVAYANCQIAMDAPYQGRVADETHRSKGRSELNFPGYDEVKLKNKLTEIFEYIKSIYSGIKIVIQIARGRAADPTFVEVLKPVLDSLGINETQYSVHFGYRTENYFNYSEEPNQFVFVNYGMFAVLSNKEEVGVGEICNPVITRDIIDYKNSNFVVNPYSDTFEDDRNILNYSSLNIKKIKLFGIADDMKFVTPDIYTKEAAESLLTI